MSEQLDAMRERLSAMLERNPASVIVFADTGERIEVATLGSEIDLRVLHAEGTRTMAGMLEQARDGKTSDE